METSPKQASPGLTALVVLALLSSLFGLRGDEKSAASSGSSPEQKTAETTTEGSAAKPQEEGKGKGPPWKEPRELYQAFFESPADTDEVQEQAKTKVVEDLKALETRGYQQRYLIALVPDPVDSHLAYRFDEAIEAIQKAFAADDYLQDRFWIPWKDKPKDAPYRGRPGVLLFRRYNGEMGATAERRLETVFLVGESPKQGIHKEAFIQAVELIRKLDPDSPVRVLGPTFSGSVESLRLALSRFVPPRPESAAPPRPGAQPFSGSHQALQPVIPGLFMPDTKFLVISGSATAKDLESYFDHYFGEAVWFGRTVVADNVLEKRAFDFLRDQLGWDLERLALVVESDTAYGQLFDREGEKRESRKLLYPSHLAHIRTAWEQGGRRAGSESEVTAAPVEPVRKPVDLSLAQTADPVDVIPELTPLTTPINDLALSALLETIARDKIRYVGIVATDIQDKLFLAEQIRTYSPNVVLFTFDSHLLDTHPQFGAAMDGTITLSSFSLQDPQPGRVRRPFSSDFQRGIFHATSDLLRREGPVYSPRIWISAVSNGTAWPIARLAPEGGARSTPGPDATKIQESAERRQIKWLAVGLVICLLGGWLWTLARPLQKSAAAAPADWPSKWTRSWSREAGWVPALGAAALSLAAGSVLAFYSLPATGLSPLSMGFELVLALSYAVAVLLGMALILGCGRNILAPTRWGGAIAWGAASLLLLPLLRAAMLRWWVPPAGEERAFERMASFTSGLSPLVPLAFALGAIYLWAVFELKRRRLIALQAMDWPLRQQRDAPLRDCQKIGEAVDQALERPLASWKFWAVVTVLFLLPVPRLLQGIQPIAERPAYGWAFLVLATAGLFLSFLSFSRFYSIWRRLERLLDRICHTWLLGQLIKDSTSFDWNPMKSFGWRMPTFKMTVQSLGKLRQIADTGMTGLSGQLDLLEDELAVAFQAERDRRLPEEVRARRWIFSWLEELTRELESQPYRVEAGVAADSPEGKKAQAIREFLSLRVVAYLRYIFAHLRNCLLSSMLGALLGLMGVTLYAFEPKQFFSFAIWATLLCGTLLTIWVFIQMDRNGALSAISGSTAGQVRFDRTFLMNVFTYGVVPLVGIVVTQFPVVGRVFSQWVDPLLRVTGLK